MSQGNKMEGLTLKSLRKYPSLIPLYFFVGCGMLGSVYYTLRLATRNPDVAWNKKNDEPWQEYENKAYKFYNPIRNYPETKADIPKY